MKQVRTRKDAFIARLQRRVKPDGACLLYNGSLTEGYPRINLRYKGKHLSIKAHRVFMILKHGKPLPMGCDVGHTPECHSRACVKHIELEIRTINSYTDPQGSHLPATGRPPDRDSRATSTAQGEEQ